MRKRVIAITGGTGFIGKGIQSKHLSLGDEVRVLSRKPHQDKLVRFFQGDLTNNSSKNIEILKDFISGADILYHCAAELTNQEKISFTNIDGTDRLLSIVKNTSLRWMQLSSVGVYGPCRSEIINEKNRKFPRGEYEESKLQSDNLVKSSGFNYTILRPSIVFGDGMKNQSLNQMIRFIKYGLFFYIDRYSMVNYVHVDEVVRAFTDLSLSESAINKEYILSDCCSIYEMVESISKGVNTSSPKKSISLKSAMALSKISKFIPFFPLTESRIKSMTSNCVYDSSLIIRDQGFKFKMELKDYLQNYAKSFEQ